MAHNPVLITPGKQKTAENVEHAVAQHTAEENDKSGAGNIGEQRRYGQGIVKGNDQNEQTLQGCQSPKLMLLCYGNLL